MAWDVNHEVTNLCLQGLEGCSCSQSLGFDSLSRGWGFLCAWTAELVTLHTEGLEEKQLFEGSWSEVSHCQ